MFDDNITNAVQRPQILQNDVGQPSTNTNLQNTSLTEAFNNARETETNIIPETEQPTTPTTPTISEGEIGSFAQSAFGDLEMTRYLYETGLQNIFTDYQRNIQTLEQQEQQQLQQAYVTRELSKKYLGEYASNVGIGDVSGNLVDIYASYAQNIGDIEQNFAELELNLTREYTMQRMQTFEQLLQNQYQMEVAELDATATQISQEAFTQYDRDVQGGLAYIDSQQENMRPQDYEAIRETYYQANVQSVLENLQSEQPYYGFADLETQTLKTKEQYLEEVQQWMSPSDYQKVQEQLAIQDIIASNEGEIDFGEPVQTVDPTLYTIDPLISQESEVYRLSNTNYAVADEPIINDDVAFNSGVDVDLLNRQFETQSGRSAAEASEGDIVQYQGFYILKEGQWHRMVSIGLQNTEIQNLDRRELESWNINYEGAGRALGATLNEIDGDWTLTINNVNFVEQPINNINRELRQEDLPMRDIIQTLNEKFRPSSRYGTGEISREEVQDYVPTGQVFVHEGEFYLYSDNGKKIIPLKRQEETVEE